MSAEDDDLRRRYPNVRINGAVTVHRRGERRPESRVACGADYRMTNTRIPIRLTYTSAEITCTRMQCQREDDEL